MLFPETWLSGYFILATNAWMQHPVAYQVADDGRVFVTSLNGLLTNPWLFWKFTRNMTATVLTASCVVAEVGAYYLLSGQHLLHAQTFLRTGVVTGAIALGYSLYFRLRRLDTSAFLASSRFIFLMLVSVMFGMYPYILVSTTDRAFSLTVLNASTDSYGLTAGIGCFRGGSCLFWPIRSISTPSSSARLDWMIRTRRSFHNDLV